MTVESPSAAPSGPWTYALLGGGVALPVVVFSYWQTGSELSLTPVFFGGILAGYLATRRTGTCDGVGSRVGVVGGLSVVWPLADLVAASSWLSGPTWFVWSASALTVGMTVSFGVLVLGFAAVLGAAGARVGGWLAGVGEGG
jgi:hypothetical protein